MIYSRILSDSDYVYFAILIVSTHEFCKTLFTHQHIPKR